MTQNSKEDGKTFCVDVYIYILANSYGINGYFISEKTDTILNNFGGNALIR